VKALPNILTGLRLVLALFVFLALATLGGAIPWLSERVEGAAGFALERWAFAAFVIAAITDFFDGWLARRFNATSVWGSILDPIADKVLVCAVILGLLVVAPNPVVAVPAALILFREFAVSALREVTAARGLKLPVTLLAKWKTTLQLLALGAEMIVSGWNAFPFPGDPALIVVVAVLAHALLWIAAIVTLITGAQYMAQARKALATI
jgi:CDP-diacylglycerol--glycerol-3-phosphate 3-phosphatidyltransferase